jgi:diguanylate cyclase (GGDEF)-like protein/PAS domain S-box-containing protein
MHIRDVSERKRTREQLARLMAEQKAILNTQTSGIVKIKNRRFAWMNTACATMLGYTEDELLNQPTSVVYPSDEAHVAFAADAYPVMLKGKVFRTDMQYRRKDGSLGWYDISGERLHQDSSESIWSFVDITERRRSEATLQLAANVFIHAREGITVADAKGAIVDVNASFTRITGYSREEVLGQNPHILHSGRQSPEFYVGMWADLLASGYWSGEIWNKRKNGEIYPELLTITAVANAQGVIDQYVGLFSDITERKQMEDKVHQLAFFDPLTKLPNRRTLGDRLSQSMLSSKRSGRYGALMVLDLDNFKPLNDVHGHAAGDVLLEALAERTMACVRGVDTVARIGGDEFVVMLSELDLDRTESISQARLIAEKIRVALAEPYSLPLTKHGKAVSVIEHRCSVSIGVVLFANHEASQEEILRWADTAMYQAKAAGRNAVRFHGADEPP